MSSPKNIIENVLDDNIIGAKDNISNILYSKMADRLHEKEQQFIPTIYNSDETSVPEMVTEKKRRDYSERETLYGIPKDEFLKLSDEMKKKVKDRYYFEQERSKKKKARTR